MLHNRCAFVLGILLALLKGSHLPAQELLTVAEKSGFQATSRHADVMDFCERLAKQSPLVRMGELGTSVEGRKLPLLIVADPAVSTPQEAAASRKLVVFALGNIHAGEVDGKEALLMLARDIALAKERPLLKNLVLVFAPIFNADGNERISRDNRKSQAGPAEGVGIRTNAQDFDLNRDFVKLESPEVRALVRLLNKWDPAVVIDCHTTNGSFHRYPLTYEAGRCPAGDRSVIDLGTGQLLPDVSRRLEKLMGVKSIPYGNFSRDRSRWETVSPTPRYGTHYIGLRNRIGILSESYSYATFKERVLASKGFVQCIFEHLAENKEKVAKVLSEARSATVRIGRDLKEGDQIVLQHNTAPLGKPFPLLGWVEEEKDGRRVATDRPKEYEVTYFAATEPTLSVRRPHAYLFPAAFAKAVENLQRHGIEVEELREDIELDLEVYKLDKLTRARLFQKHELVSVQATPRKESRRIPAGAILVKTAQNLGSLAAYLLEPQSADGLTTWNFFDDGLKEGQDHPVARLPTATPLLSIRVRPLPEDRVMNKPITYELVHGGGPPFAISGSPINGLTWLDDEHYLHTRDGRPHKVNALTGRAQPHPQQNLDKLAEGFGSLPTIGKPLAQKLVRGFPRINSQRTGALLEHENDLYYCNFDGSGATRLTKTPGSEELATFSPDGKFVAFVRDNNLYVVDIKTQTERAVTTDGSSLIFNGKADWVYFEEIFNRSRQAYWWSPDSSRLIFLRFDDTPVRKFPVVDHIPTRSNLETTPYPKAGDANPLVKLAIASVGGAVRWVELNDYTETATLIVRAGFMPDSETAYFYVQDRAQTWLDFCTVGRDGGEPTRLFRETTKAWVDDPGAPTFLKDGSFLLPSERTGWKHFYHYAKDGKLKRAVTSGNWEARTLHLVDEEAGFVYFSGTCDSHIASNLYRARLDGSGVERLTKTAGDHRVSISPKGKLFIDNWTNSRTPTQVRLYRADGTLVRTLDTNPVYEREEYRFGFRELVQIKTPDGFLLEGILLKPPNFDPQKRYPVWFMTYAGPHAPTVSDTWSGGRLADEAKADMGYVVFHCDPRSASGKGACSTWTAYRQLGVQEMKDIEAAINWLKSHPFVDGSRIGMSGRSYGGFMTAYAMTHSKLFAAGIAGAPVTDWRNYDTIYTERYMNTPQENPDGYRNTSVVAAARHLHGRLLIMHGLMDDNVHVQNSLQLVEALQRANKEFEVMFYPRARHNMFGAHYTQCTYDFMGRTLQPEGYNEWKAKRAAVPTENERPAFRRKRAALGPD